MAVNTLGVLYVVEKGDTVHSVADLKGRTQSCPPARAPPPSTFLRYILQQNGIDPDKDVTIEFYSEATRSHRPDGRGPGCHRRAAPALCDLRLHAG